MLEGSGRMQRGNILPRRLRKPDLAFLHRCFSFGGFRTPAWGGKPRTPTAGVRKAPTIAFLCNGLHVTATMLREIPAAGVARVRNANPKVAARKRCAARWRSAPCSAVRAGGECGRWASLQLFAKTTQGMWRMATRPERVKAAMTRSRAVRRAPGACSSRVRSAPLAMTCFRAAITFS